MFPTRLLWLLLLAATSASQTATAQGSLAPYFPLEVGDEWVYQTYNASSAQAYIEILVPRDTTVAGSRMLLLERRGISLNGTPGDRTTCGVEAGPDGLPVVRFVVPDGASCSVNEHFGRIHQVNSIQHPQSVEIGGVQYALVSTGSFSSGSSHGQTSTSTSWVYGEGVGFLGYRFSQTWGGSTSTSGTRLVYARVGGVEYGSRPFPTASEAHPLRSTLSVVAYPNPFSSEIRVAVTGASGPVIVELFDVAGRRVSTAVVGPAHPSARLMPDAAGVYFVRASDASGRVTVHRVTRL